MHRRNKFEKLYPNFSKVIVTYGQVGDYLILSKKCVLFKLCGSPENGKGKNRKIITFYTQNYNLLKIQNKSLMRAPIRAETSDYVKL